MPDHPYAPLIHPITGPSINDPIEPTPLTKPITALAALRPSISPNSVGTDDTKMMSGPQFRKPTRIMTIELTAMPMLAVAMKRMRAKALRSVPTVDPSRALLLKKRLRQ